MPHGLYIESAMVLYTQTVEHVPIRTLQPDPALLSWGTDQTIIVVAYCTPGHRAQLMYNSWIHLLKTSVPNVLDDACLLSVLVYLPVG